MRLIICSIVIFWGFNSSIDAQNNSDFQLDFGLNYSNIVYPGIGYNLEGIYNLNSTYSVGLSFETTQYCFMCGLTDISTNSTIDTYTYRKVIINSYRNFSLNRFSLYFGCQAGLGFASYKERFDKPKLENPQFFFGFIFGVQYKTIRIALNLRNQEGRGNEWLHPNLRFGLLLF